jgi:hypothetical protein
MNYGPGCYLVAAFDECRQLSLLDVIGIEYNLFNLLGRPDMRGLETGSATNMTACDSDCRWGGTFPA